ncbi:MAG: phosphoesterase [Gemmataceae bacterium]
MAVEQVLVIPTRVLHDAGLFQGFSRRVEHYLPLLLEPTRLSFLPRPQAEDDPSFKQIIPYVLLRHGDRLFHYRRGKGGGEKRLTALRSVGVGGHINPVDHRPGADPYRQGMLRELEEEIFIETSYRETCLGLINDDSQPVGRVHLGIVHLLELDAPLVRRREEQLDASGFAPLTELQKARNEFETWSQLALDAVALI